MALALPGVILGPTSGHSNALWPNFPHRKQIIGALVELGFPGEVLAQWAMVMGVAAVMEGKAADWVADLYSNHAGELGDIGLFLSAVQERFENNA